MRRPAPMWAEIQIASPDDSMETPYGTSSDSYSGMADQWWSADSNYHTRTAHLLALAHEAACRQNIDELRVVLVLLGGAVVGWIDDIDMKVNMFDNSGDVS